VKERGDYRGERYPPSIFFPAVDPPVERERGMQGGKHSHAENNTKTITVIFANQLGYILDVTASLDIPSYFMGLPI
jgi:hypothetical protein